MTLGQDRICFSGEKTEVPLEAGPLSTSLRAAGPVRITNPDTQGDSASNSVSSLAQRSSTEASQSQNCRFLLFTSCSGIRFPAQNVQNGNWFRGFLNHSLGTARSLAAPIIRPCAGYSLHPAAVFCDSLLRPVRRLYGSAQLGYRPRLMKTPAAIARMAMRIPSPEK
jgi:hypothetical protein